MSIGEQALARTRRQDLPTPRRDARTRSAGAVLTAVLDHGPVARSSVARVTGLSAASLTGIAGELIGAGLLREAPEAAGPPGQGRPHIPLDLDADHIGVIGVHVAVTRITVGLLDLRGQVLERFDDPHDSRDVPGTVAEIARRISAVQHRTGRRIAGIGAATGGWVDSDTGAVVEHPLLGWQDVPLRDLVADATGLAVAVDGHARALIRAEQLFGAQAPRARESAVHLFVGNVVDVAFASGPAVHRGPRSAAGIVAHLPIDGCTERCPCGRVGCLQAAVSEQTVVRRAVAAGIADDLRGLIDAAVAGDRRAIDLFAERARLVGRAAGVLLDVLNPEVLVVSEAGAVRLPECLAALRAEAGRQSTVCADPEKAVVPTSFPDSLLATAGGAAFLDRIYTDPLGAVPAPADASR